MKKYQKILCSHTLLFFHSLAPILVLFSIMMLFLTDSFDGTIFWLCVMFSSVIFLLIFGIFLLFSFNSVAQFLYP